MSFYLGRYAELYDLFYSQKPYADEARVVRERLVRHGQDGPLERVLELACGTGAHALALAKSGLHVDATDCSPSMLKMAEHKAGAAANVRFSECDMQAIPRPVRPYDAAICLFDSIGYVGGDENLDRVFAGVRAALRPGGLFLFEYWNAATMTRNFEPLRVRRLRLDESEIIRISETTLIPEINTAQVAYDIYELNPDGAYRRHSEVQRNRFFSVEEMDAFAPKHGFEPLATYAGYEDSTTITDDTWHVVSVWSAAP